MDPDSRNKKDDVQFLNLHVGQYPDTWLSVLFLHHLWHVRSSFITNTDLPWKDLVGLCLLFCRLEILSKVQNLRMICSLAEYGFNHLILLPGFFLELISQTHKCRVNLNLKLGI